MLCGCHRVIKWKSNGILSILCEGYSISPTPTWFDWISQFVVVEWNSALIWWMTEGKWAPSILSRNGNRWTNIELKIIWQTSLCATEWRVRIINDTFPPLTSHSQSIWTESTHTRGKSYCQWVSPLLIFIFLFALRYEFLTLMVFYWSADQSPAYSVTLPLRNPICDIDLINLLCTGGGWILFWKVKEL